ncbi:PD-(D/E)XK motif protein [Corallococcus exercitus]|uniref:PD-(D/E)XK motif protein n=1 Tax=Corallococcus exercitus TaxID=2316736 RepID=UPI0035D4A272
MHDLVQLYEQLPAPVPAEEGAALSLSALPVPGWNSYRVSLSADGAPGLLVATQSGPVSGIAALELKNLSFRPRVRCRVSTPSRVGAEEGEFALIRCKGPDEELRRLFLHIAGGWLPALGPTPTLDALADAVDELSELFAALSRPARSSVQGLWAELLLIASSPAPKLLALAWHSQPRELHDFCAGGQRMEVKSTLGPLREHTFSLNQLQVSADVTLVVASVKMEEHPEGLSVEDLVGAASARVPAVLEHRARLEQVVALSLGRDWREAARVRFRLQESSKSVAYFRGADVPSITSQLPAEVSDVRFRSDLSGEEPLAHAELHQAGGLLAALAPADRVWVSAMEMHLVSSQAHPRS